MKLSVALAIFNEEKAIARCLESVYEIADEIVIVDGGSTDKTLKLVKELDKSSKIHIFNEENPPMFHINKQKALEKCKGDWILQLDADEVVSEELAREIKIVIEERNVVIPAKAGIHGSPIGVGDDKTILQNDKFVAYWIPRLNYFLGKPLRKGGQYPDHTIRLYRNGKAKFPCKSVHEQVEVRRTETLSEQSESKGQISYLKQDLLHFPYQTFGDYVNKWIRYGMLEADLAYQLGEKPSAFNFVLYIIVYPKWWFLKTYFRHKGFMDGFSGFVFSLFSSLRYWITYIRLYELTRI